MLGLSPHPGVSYLFQNQTHVSSADEALWNVALGSTGLGGTAPGGGMVSSPPPSWTPALGELVLKVDSKFKVRKSTVWYCAYGDLTQSSLAAFLLSPRCSRISTCSRGTVSRMSWHRSIRSCAILVGVGMPPFLSFGQARHPTLLFCSRPFGVGTQPSSLGWHINSKLRRACCTIASRS
jgi:hypothetical protein